MCSCVTRSTPILRLWVLERWGCSEPSASLLNAGPLGRRSGEAGGWRCVLFIIIIILFNPSPSKKHIGMEQGAPSTLGTHVLFALQLHALFSCTDGQESEDRQGNTWGSLILLTPVHCGAMLDVCTDSSEHKGWAAASAPAPHTPVASHLPRF